MLETFTATDTPRLSDCPWYGRPSSSNPWWARIDCAGRMMEWSGLCEAHHNAQPDHPRA